jgi:hypothetical protein
MPSQKLNKTPIYRGVKREKNRCMIILQSIGLMYAQGFRLFRSNCGPKAAEDRHNWRLVRSILWTAGTLRRFRFMGPIKSVNTYRSMKYASTWAKTLNSDEKVQYEFSVADKYRYVYLVVLLILGGILFFTPLITIALPYSVVVAFYFGFYLKVANAYALTDRRILIHRGWLSTHTISVEYNKITDVTVIEPFLEKLITQTGHLAVNTAGSGGNEIILKHIEHPYELKKRIDQMR